MWTQKLAFAAALFSSVLAACDEKTERLRARGARSPAPAPTVVNEEMRDDDAILGVVKLFSEITPKTLAGTNVHLDDVPVQAKAGRGLWIGPDSKSALFVVPSDPSTLARIAVGDRVDLKGKIREMPPIDEAVKQFELDRTTTLQATSEAVYIEATELANASLRPSS